MDKSVILHVHSFVQKSPLFQTFCNVAFVAFQGDKSSADRDKNSDEFSGMEETLKSNEENTGDTDEDKTGNSEDSEVCHGVFIVLRLEG